MHFKFQHLLPAICVASMLVIAGCTATRVSDSLTAHYAASDTQVQMEFWHRLAQKPLVSHDEALHGILLYLDEHDFCDSYTTRYAALQKRGIVTSSISLDADSAIDHGELSVMLVHLLGDQGGLTMHLLGANPRLATRRLRYRGIYPEVTENQLVRGDAFVGILGKVDDVQSGGNVYLPAFMLPNGQLSNNDMAELIPGGGVATEPSTQSANATTQPADSVVVIDGIQGEFVEVRQAPDQQWQLAQVGMHLDQSAEFRTGPHSAVRFLIPPDQTYTLDRLGVVGVRDVIRQGKVAQTDVHLDYGRVRYDLEPISPNGSARYNAAEPALQHSTTIRSPSSTLAVRGTRVALYDQAPYVPEAISLVGRAEFQNALRQRIAFGTKQTVTNKVTANRASAAETAQGESFVDPTIALARTPDEYPLLLSLISSGATVNIDRGDGLPIVRGGTPPDDAQLLALLKGQFDVVLRWTGETNLDLAVGNQAGRHGEFIFPAPGFIGSASGGRTAFNDIGGPNGGIEIIFWNRPPPSGIYAIGIANQGSNPAIATVDAFSNRKSVPLFDPNMLMDIPRFTQSIPPGTTAATSVRVNFAIPVLPQNVELERQPRISHGH